MIISYDKELKVTEKEDGREVCVKLIVYPDTNDKEYRVKLSEMGLFNPYEEIEDRTYKNRRWKWININEEQMGRYKHFLNTGSGAVLRALEREVINA